MRSKNRPAGEAGLVVQHHRPPAFPPACGGTEVGLVHPRQSGQQVPTVLPVPHPLVQKEHRGDGLFPLRHLDGAS
ncbi:MAG TPA: hypothetical protein ENI39_00480 [Anaerolineae bacterium]|nr:hypothetical protein [Anaerolineae bacterium]